MPQVPPLITGSPGQHLCSLWTEQVSEVEAPLRGLVCLARSLYSRGIFWLCHRPSCCRDRTLMLLTGTVQDTFSLKRIKHGVLWRLHQYLIYSLCFVFCIMKYSVGG